MDVNNYRIFRIIKYFLYFILKPIIVTEYLIYIFFHKVKKTQRITRIFTTTGNISLINSLAIIKEIGNYDCYNDILLIDTGKGRKNFVKNQLKIAQLHNFKQIIIGIQTPPGIEIVFHNIFKVDEIYLLNHPAHIGTVLQLFKFAKVVLIDEGPASLIDYTKDKIKNLDKFKTHRYLGKIDFLTQNKTTNIKFENIDLNIFQNIAQKLASEAPINIIYDKNDKVILYCGIYWEMSGLSKENFQKLQTKTINNLLNAGYKILYKSHPRDTEFYEFDKNPNVQFVSSKFPIEIYNLDILAIVSISSTASITPAHYHNIPCFCNVIEDSLKKNQSAAKLNLIRYIVKEYAPNYEILLSINIKDISKEDLRQQILKLYNNFIMNKPLLSVNRNVKEYLLDITKGNKK